jgi:hypothetical protein
MILPASRPMRSSTGPRTSVDAGVANPVVRSQAPVTHTSRADHDADARSPRPVVELEPTLRGEAPPNVAPDRRPSQPAARHPRLGPGTGVQLRAHVRAVLSPETPGRGPHSEPTAWRASYTMAPQAGARCLRGRSSLTLGVPPLHQTADRRRADRRRDCAWASGDAFLRQAQTTRRASAEVHWPL